MEVHAMDGVSANCCQRIEDAYLSFCEFTRQSDVNKHHPYNISLCMKWNTGSSNAFRNLVTVFARHLWIVAELARHDCSAKLDDQSGNAFTQFMGRFDIFLAPASLGFEFNGFD